MRKLFLLAFSPLIIGSLWLMICFGIKSNDIGEKVFAVVAITVFIVWLINPALLGDTFFNLENAEFTSSNISNSVFDDAKMRAAKVNLATIGDCSFVDCDLFVVDFSEAFLNNRSIERIRKARIFNLENLDR